MIEYKRVEGSQEEKPLAIDTVSSETTVYIRKNIQRIEKKDEQSGNTYEMWEYDEAQLTREQYTDYLTEQLQKTQEAVDFLLMNGGV